MSQTVITHIRQSSQLLQDLGLRSGACLSTCISHPSTGKSLGQSRQVMTFQKFWDLKSHRASVKAVMAEANGSSNPTASLGLIFWKYNLNMLTQDLSNWPGGFPVTPHLSLSSCLLLVTHDQYHFSPRAGLLFYVAHSCICLLYTSPSPRD